MIITEILKQNNRLYRDQTALIERIPSTGERNEISWNQFYTLSCQFANALARKGIGKSHKVAQLMSNSLNWLPIYFGILYSGAWAVPFNFRLEAEKILLCSQVSEAKVFVFGEEFVNKIESIKIELESIVDTWIFAGQEEVCPDWAYTFENFIKNENGLTPPDINIDFQDPAALYFTSGTTGNPKAVLLSHKNLEQACIVEQQHHGQTHDDIFLCIPPLYHTGAKMHWMGSFLVGGKCILLRGVKPEWIMKTISEERCTIVWLLVPWIHDIIIAIENGIIDINTYNIKQFRLMHAGAQPIPPTLVESWHKYFPGQAYDTNYGLTEATGPGCIHLGVENGHKIGAIGLPGYGWEAKVVDKQGEKLFGNETGELIVKGPGVMKEYFKNPEATSQVLKDGWLYTGDIARYDMDGFIWLVDRKKDIIIYGGENIFPVEIENFLLRHEKIKDIAVIGIPDNRLGEIPAGIISIKPGMILSESDILEFQAELPRYKQLKKIFFGEVPRSPTGKIEKPKLRRLYAEDRRKDVKKLLQ